ncbi:MAG: hypothetical protein Q8Q31_02230 [Nanoarchaeota archaeon]|nr:hypothetical protein [Nanoarchaeota archaeon]
MRWEIEKEAVGLLSRLFGEDGSLFYQAASEDALQDFSQGKGPFNKTFLRYIYRTYGPEMLVRYFSDYRSDSISNPFAYLAQVGMNMPHGELSGKEGIDYEFEEAHAA